MSNTRTFLPFLPCLSPPCFVPSTNGIMHNESSLRSVEKWCPLFPLSHNLELGALPIPCCRTRKVDDDFYILNLQASSRRYQWPAIEMRGGLGGKYCPNAILQGVRFASTGKVKGRDLSWEKLPVLPSTYCNNPNPYCTAISAAKSPPNPKSIGSSTTSLLPGFPRRRARSLFPQPLKRRETKIYFSRASCMWHLDCPQAWEWPLTSCLRMCAWGGGPGAGAGG